MAASQQQQIPDSQEEPRLSNIRVGEEIICAPEVVEQDPFDFSKISMIEQQSQKKQDWHTESFKEVISEQVKQ